jgi:hypothetical protein
VDGSSPASSGGSAGRPAERTGSGAAVVEEGDESREGGDGSHEEGVSGKKN